MFIKDIFDRLFAILGLIILSPLLLIIAVLLKIKMPVGPIIFKQKRIGKNSKPFVMYKFRTMTNDHSGSSISILGEKRITPFGSILRKYKLDELPELFNVLLGDMSFVGPRPDVPGYADLLKGKDRDILKLKPGITGPSSLKYKNEEQILSMQENPQEYNDKVIYPDKIKINLNYLENRSFFLDIKIIIYTLIGKDLEKSK
jgi:lipopolysaccharide/colanic/teichoic acid biosynthesis glycosyltransferase